VVERLASAALALGPTVQEQRISGINRDYQGIFAKNFFASNHFKALVVQHDAEQGISRLEKQVFQFSGGHPGVM
jgi:hypothetical protein